MNPERWRQVSRLFKSAIERAPGERAGYLEGACAGDDALRGEVESLISSYEQAGDRGFISTPAVDVAATIMEADAEGLAPGACIAHYCVLNEIGAGGMGAVYLAEDTKPEHRQRRVALKLLHPKFTRDADRLRRFEQEAEAALVLNHPNVMTIYEIGEDGGRRFIATEFIEGITLRQRMSERRLKLGEVLDVATQVAAGLAAAHAAGIVHRDVKPENVMIRRDGYVKVLDFGLAKLTEKRAWQQPEQGGDGGNTPRTLVRTNPGMVLGTVSYMSPEQSQGHPVDERTDVWSLGVVLYEMVARRLPFEGEDIYLQSLAIRDDEPKPLAAHAEGVPERLDEIVRKALAKCADDRYQTVRDLLIDLQYLKRKLEVDAEIERSLRPAREGASRAVDRGARAADAAASEVTLMDESRAARRGATAAAATAVGAGKSGRKLFGLLAALALAVVAVALAAWLLTGRQTAQALTDKDTILLSDFVNTTGDPVFDGTLKQALAVQLGQSPFLNIFSDERAREALKFMGRPADERVTREVGREMCQRQGLKALLAGSIAGMGSRYVITLEAVNAQTGDTLAREQAEADGKEEVLRALGEAATRMRAKLGESLQSIHQFDAPIEQATTPSLEALKAYSMGREKNIAGSYLEAVPFFKRAVELDPNFASAYWAAGVSYANSRQQELATEAARRAFDLRGRASEREKLHISANYYLNTGEADKHLEVLEVLVRTYPRDSIARNNLGNRYVLVGQHEKAVAELRAAIDLNPGNAVAYTNLAIAFMHLNRFEEAKAVCDEALEKKLDSSGLRANLYYLAFIRGDADEVRRQTEWFAGKPDEYIAQNLQSLAALFSGRVKSYEEFNGQCVDALQSKNLKEVAASATSHRPLTHALLGDCRRVGDETASALAVSRGRDALRNSALAFSLCGETAQAQALADERARLNPQDTLLHAVWLPVVRASVETRRGNHAEAIQILQPARQYEAGTLFSLWPAYVRGQAHLGQRDAAAAEAEFRRILDRRGLLPVSVLYPLSQLGLARAAALSGDEARARTAYQDFFALWKDADPDIPILQQARREYEKLR